jgi:hypothetical protein
MFFWNLKGFSIVNHAFWGTPSRGQFHRQRQSQSSWIAASGDFAAPPLMAPAIENWIIGKIWQWVKTLYPW